jgi:hypothetical protein
VKSVIKTVLAFALVMVAPSLFACAACAGGKIDSNMTQGMNAGIFVLLGVVGFVLCCTATVGIYFVRRASRMSETAENSSEPIAQPTI